MPNQIAQFQIDGGINLLIDRKRIPDNEAVETRNLIPVQPGILGKRPGQGFDQYFGGFGGLGYPVAVILAAGNSAASEGAWVNLVVGVGTSTDGMYVYGMNPSNTGVQIGPSSLRAPSFLQIGTALYVYPGYGGNATAYRLGLNSSDSPDFAPWAFTGTGNDLLRPKVATMYKQRIVYGNFGPGYENALVWADVDQPNVVGNSALGSRAVYVGAADGDEIVAIVPITQTSVGSPTAEALLVLKHRSAYVITGSPYPSTYSPVAPENYSHDTTVNAISYAVGCSSAASLVKTPYGIIWASDDDVWFFATGSLPIRIGTKIRPALQNSSAADQWRWHAAYHNGFYRLAVLAAGQNTDGSWYAPWVAGQSVSANQTKRVSSGNVYIAVTTGVTGATPPGGFDRVSDGAVTWDWIEAYKPFVSCEEQYWLDLRSGPPQGHMDARWWGPQVYSTSSYVVPFGLKGSFCMTPEVRANRSPALFGMMMDDVYNCRTRISYDVPGTVHETISTPVSQFTPRVDSYYGEILCSLKTKEYDLGDPMLRKVITGLETNSWISSDQRLTTRLYLDGGAAPTDWNLDITAPGLRTNIDRLDVVGAGVLTREFQAFKAEPTDDSRVIGKTLQLEIFDNNGWLIVEGFNDRILFYQRATGPVTLAPTPGSSPRIAIIPAGYYLDIGDLSSAFGSALTEASGVVCSFSLVSNLLRLTITGSYINWVGPANINPGVASATDLDASQRVGAMLGFDVTTYDYVNQKDATTETYITNTCDWEFAMFSLRFRGMPRRPL